MTDVAEVAVGKAVPKDEVVDARLGGMVGEDWCPFEALLGTMVCVKVNLGTTSKGGIVIVTQGQQKRKPNVMVAVRILALGPGKVLDNGHVLPAFVKVGDTVLVAEQDLVEYAQMGMTWYLGQVDSSWVKLKLEWLKK